MFEKFSAQSVFDENGKPKAGVTKALDAVLRVQRPLVVSLLKKLREKHPDETPSQIQARIEKQYLRDVTVGGGAVGASAFIPGIGTATSIGLSALAIGGYLERTAVYAQQVAELNGVEIQNEDEARAMVMAIMLGEDGSNLMGTILAQSTKSSSVSNKWGLMMGKKDNGKLFSVERTLRNMFIKRFLTAQSGALLGRALPFGIGAVVGGGANLALGKNVIESAHQAFGEAPATFPESLNLDRAPKFTDPKPAEEKKQGEISQ